MKKIILVLFLFLSCYLIYNFTEQKHFRVLSLGDSGARCVDYINDDLFTERNSSFVDDDYRIIDLILALESNEKNNNDLSIHRLLKRADILIVSVGMNDIYFKLNDDTKEIYSYVNEMVENMDNLINIINKYNYTKVFILGYYNIYNDKNDIFTYLNYKVKKIAISNGYDYIDLNNVIKNVEMVKKIGKFELNSNGYEEINKIIVEKLKNY